MTIEVKVEKSKHSTSFNKERILLSGFPICFLWAYQMKVIQETHRAH
jgi:hypothetical protein